MQVTDPHQDRRGQQQQHRAVVLVIGNPQAPELSVLEQLPPGAQVLAVAQTFQELSHLSEEQWCSIDVVCKMGGGKMGGGSIPPTSTPNTISSTCAAAAGKSAGDGRNNSGVGSAAVAGGSGSETSDKVWHGVQAHIHRCNSSSVSLTQSLEEFWPKLSGLKWLHTATVGTEHLLTPELVNSAVTVTNARGVYSHSLAEFVIMACLFFAKGLPQYLSAQAARRWEMFEVEELRGATLGIIGFGSIGRAVAEMAHVHQMRVVALRRHPEQSQQELADGLLAEVLPREHLHQLLAQSDYVVLATPHSPDTHRMVDAAAIAAMKPNAVLINVGRGKCIDEAALVAALETGRIKGAALDVFEEEPLPPSSRLWGLQNVLISPHCSARTRCFMLDNMNVFVDNLRRYVAGRPLQNVIDKQCGY